MSNEDRMIPFGLHLMSKIEGMVSRHALRIALGIMIVAVTASCTRREPPEALAKVGDAVITGEDFKAEVERRKEQGRPVPDKETVLEEMVEREALVQRAKAEGLPADPEVRREIRNLLVGKLKERRLLPRLDAIEVTPAEIQADYDKNLDDYQKPEMVRLAILFLEGSPGMSDDKRDRLNSRLEEARREVIADPPPGGRGPAAGGFGQLAVRYSEDQASRYRGGDIGWLEAGRYDYSWPRPVLEAGYALEEDGVSSVIEAEDGFYLVMKTDSREPRTTPLSEVETRIRDRLRKEKRNELRASFRESAREVVGVEIDRDRLGSLTLPDGSDPGSSGESLQPPEPPAAPSDGPPATPTTQE